MSAHIKQTIIDLQAKLKAQEDEVIKTKQLINLLCEHTGLPPIYADSALAPASSGVSIRADEFYGQPLATAIRSILEKRKLADRGPATPREIYDALVEGGYKFDTDSEPNRLIGVRVSLRKSSAIFHRLPDGKRYGLLEWYPKEANRRSRTKTDEDLFEAADTAQTDGSSNIEDDEET